MADVLMNYQCPSCTGPLHYVGNSGKVECDYCGSKFDIEEIEKYYQEKENQTAVSFDEQKKKETEETQWDYSGLNDDWGEDQDKLVMYNCPSCGAELICDNTTAATSCPYCGNPTVVSGQVSGTLRPDYLIPFQYDKQHAIDALKKHYRGKLLLPNEFTEKNHIEEMKGLYVPFWLYDCTVDMRATFRGERTNRYTSGDHEITETKVYHVERDGEVTFHQIPADGSSKMADDYMDSIEPFDFTQMKPFSTAYLPGYLADRYDVSAEDNAERADHRALVSTENVLRSDVHGYPVVIKTSSSAKMYRGKVSYAFMPVWTLHTKFRGKDYMFMMNGQTGKMVGDLPISYKKFFLYFFILFLVISALFYFSGISTTMVVWLYG